MRNCLKYKIDFQNQILKNYCRRGDLDKNDFLKKIQTLKLAFNFSKIYFEPLKSNSKQDISILL